MKGTLIEQCYNAIKSGLDFKFIKPIIDKLNINEVKTKFLKIKITSVKTCPDWHKGAGGKAWLFIDEITIK